MFVLCVTKIHWTAGRRSRCYRKPAWRLFWIDCEFIMHFPEIYLHLRLFAKFSVDARKCHASLCAFKKYAGRWRLACKYQIDKTKSVTICLKVISGDTDLIGTVAGNSKGLGISKYLIALWKRCDGSAWLVSVSGGWRFGIKVAEISKKKFFGLIVAMYSTEGRPHYLAICRGRPDFAQ